jgi:hypothetical protein
MTRPLAVDNEGDGTIQFFSGGTLPPEPSVSEGKKSDGKKSEETNTRRRKGKGGN